MSMLVNDSEIDELAALRRKIDGIDDEILRLLKERFDSVIEVGVFKAKNGILSLQPRRWEQVLADKIKKGGESGLDKKMVEKIWNSIHEVAVRVEDAIKARISGNNNV